MKIDVITFHNVNNYGSVLQTYATQWIFEKFGYDVEIIDYCRRDQIDYKSQIKNSLEKSSFWKKNIVTKLVYSIIKSPSYRKQSKNFTSFLAQYIHLSKDKYYSIDDLLSNPPRADVYCTGSDQMWNSYYNAGIERAYYLDFVEGHKKIAFSTSIGLTEFPSDEVATITKLLEKYYAISVREKSGQKLLSSIGINNVTHVLDPTLMLTKENWQDIASPRLIKRPYVLIYQLNPNKKFDEFAANLARKKGLKLVRINNLYDHIMKNGKPFFIPKVEEYLSLFMYADYIVTDSFHGTAFCLNLQKQFFVFYPPKFSTRLDSIVTLTGLKNRIVEDNNYLKLMKGKIDYSEVSPILEEERSKTIDFIKMALN